VDESRVGRRAHRERPAKTRRRALFRRGLPVAVVVLAAVAAIVGLEAWPGRTAPSKAANSPGTSTTVPTTTTTTAPPPYVPPPVTPTISPALPGEGVWVEQDTWNPGPPAVMTTSFRPDPGQPAIVAYASWIRSSTTQLALYPGYEGPGPTAPGVDRGPEMVPETARTSLLATFNSGFYEADAAGGFFAHGILYFPMVDGLATVIQYADGAVNVVDWQGGPIPGPSVEMARQNLPLLVDAGAPTAATNDPSRWGLTLGGVPAVWRTALGIDSRGNLVYVAAGSQTAPSLAEILVRLGVVRGMQLDINPEWPIFVTYGGPGASSPSLDVPNPNQIPNRFLYASTKDFFAVFERQPGTGPVVQPW
jgi:hypothetical protein